MVIPGHDVPARDCPPAVVDRCWEVARCFQNWEGSRLDELVENWPATAADFEEHWVLAIFGCATQDLEPVEPLSDASDNLTLFATSVPDEVVFAFTCTMDITPVIVGLDGTRLMLGRTTRLASADQRRALAVLHRTCTCCDTPFDRCQIHHVEAWDKGGATDITRLLPLCPRCHHLVHEGGWTIELHRDRSVTLIGPNGERREHPPPRLRAA